MVDGVAFEREDGAGRAGRTGRQQRVVAEVCTDVDDHRARPDPLAEQANGVRLDATSPEPPEVALVAGSSEHPEAVDGRPSVVPREVGQRAKPEFLPAPPVRRARRHARGRVTKSQESVAHASRSDSIWSRRTSSE